MSKKELKDLEPIEVEGVIEDEDEDDEEELEEEQKKAKKKPKYVPEDERSVFEKIGDWAKRTAREHPILAKTVKFLGVGTLTLGSGVIGWKLGSAMTKRHNQQPVPTVTIAAPVEPEEPKPDMEALEPEEKPLWEET